MGDSGQSVLLEPETVEHQPPAVLGHAANDLVRHTGRDVGPTLSRHMDFSARPSRDVGNDPSPAFPGDVALD
jgi:hypothetical protein